MLKLVIENDYVVENITEFQEQYIDNLRTLTCTLFDFSLDLEELYNDLDEFTKRDSLSIQVKNENNEVLWDNNNKKCGRVTIYRSINAEFNTDFIRIELRRG